MRPRRVVHVEGDNPVGRLVRHLLAGRVTVVDGPIDEAATAQSDAMIACEGWLPDARWRRIDAWCAEHNVAWHMCYAEGLRFYAGPLAVAGRTAAYRDARGRRLAAAGAADELLAYWAYLDGGMPLPPVPWPSEGAVAVIGGVLVADVLAFLAGGSFPSEGCQLEIDPSDLSVRRHPVLPPSMHPGLGDGRAACAPVRRGGCSVPGLKAWR